MTTSGTVTFSVNRDDICKHAMYDCGALGIGETMSDDDLQFCSFRLNLLVKQYMGTIDLAPGLKVWSRKSGNLFLSNTTGTYFLGTSYTTASASGLKTNVTTRANGWCSQFSQTTVSTSAAIGSSTVVVASITDIPNNRLGIGVGPNGVENTPVGVSLNDGSILWALAGLPSGNTVSLLEPNTLAPLTLPAAVNSGNAFYWYQIENQARRPLQILTAVLRDSNSNDTPLWFYNLQDYETLPSKKNTQNTGDPTTVYYKADLGTGILKTDVAAAADTSKYIHMEYLSPIEDFNSATDTPDYPQEWYRPLVKALAVEIAPAFSLPVTQDMLQAKAEAMAIAGRSNPETSSMFFQPKNDDYMPWGQF